MRNIVALVSVSNGHDEVEVYTIHLEAIARPGFSAYFK